MMETLSRNNAYRNKAAKLYELAKVYLPVEGEDLPREDMILTLGTYGAGESFFTLKGEIETILRSLNGKVNAVFGLLEFIYACSRNRLVKHQSILFKPCDIFICLDLHKVALILKIFFFCLLSKCIVTETEFPVFFGTNEFLYN